MGKVKINKEPSSEYARLWLDNREIKRKIGEMEESISKQEAANRTMRVESPPAHPDDQMVKKRPNPKRKRWF